MDTHLTFDDLDKIDMLRISIDDIPLEAPVWRSEPLLRRSGTQLPLEHEAASESFLVAELEGRCRLSNETRLREEARLRKKARVRKKHGGASRGRRHWKSKEATKRRRNQKGYEEKPYEWFMNSVNGPADVTREEFDRKLRPVFEEHPHGSLRWKRLDASRAFDIYNMDVFYFPRDTRNKPLPSRQVYNGRNELMDDIQVRELQERAMFLESKGRKKS